MNVVSLFTDGDIGVITIDNPPVNALSQGVRSGLRETMARANADPALAALMICCAGRTFVAGADIREFDKPWQPPDLSDVIGEIENSPKFVVAAIHGTALGGGLELALGCHYRVAATTAKVGFPEVKLGLLPGAGGTQRLPRLIGPEEALKLIVDGNPIAAPLARKIGIFDEIVEGDLKAGALVFARRMAAEKRPWRRISVLKAAPASQIFYAEFEQSMAKKQRGLNAPAACIAAVKAASELPFVEGCKRERELFIELLGSSQSKALRHVFFAEREVARIPGLPADQATRDVRSIGVVGAGTMGGGIAMSFANAGIPVTLLEMSRENLERGIATIRKNYSNTVAKGGLKQEEMTNRMALISPTLAFDDLRTQDMVIEAVFEEMDVKKGVFRKLDAICKSGAILASNTSYLDINEIAGVTQRPGDVMGMHFFSPANVMKLLENVRGAKTSADVLATAMKVGRAIGKTPVAVGVCPGFVGNRMLGAYLREQLFMLEEGALPQQVDKVLYDFGFPMGPFAVSDLAGLDIGWRNRKAFFDHLTPRERANNLIDKICGLGRYGQKTGAGFYKYDENRRAAPDPIIEELIVNHSKERGLRRRQISDQEILERSLYSMINEGAKVLEEGIAARPSDIDVVWVLGYGFPRYRGGPMFYADQIGLDKIRGALLKYSEPLGAEYWNPAPLLARLTKEGKGFYGPAADEALSHPRQA